MALGTILDYLISQRLKHSLVIDQREVLKNITLEFYQMKNQFCFLYTEQGHELKLPVPSYPSIWVESLGREVTDHEEMKRCLKELDTKKPYSVYLLNNQGGRVYGFCEIG
ncbi:hypothetical protein ACHXY8_10395 [Neobacillus thermocopriae]